MKGHQKILQLNSNLSKLIDSLCFELAVNKPDENSLSLIEILEWRNNNEISQEQLKELYSGWLESKNIYDLFTAKQIHIFPKDQLLDYDGPIKKFINISQITKILEILNNLYNQIYIEKKIKAVSSANPINPRNQIKNIEEVQKLFSFLDASGIINLRLSQLFFLCGALMISEKQEIGIDFQGFKVGFKKMLNEMSCINGCVSLRAFKNYFLVQKQGHFIKNLGLVLNQIKNLANLTSQIKNQKSDSLPDIFSQSILKWKSYPIFRNQEKKVQFLKRLFQQNQQALLFNQQVENESVNSILTKKYGTDFLSCLQIDSKLLNQFKQILQDTVNKYINLFQKVSIVLNKNLNHKPHHNEKSNLIESNLRNSKQKKQRVFESQILSNKKVPKTAAKQRTPQKKAKNYHDFSNSTSYRNKTPTNKNSRQNGGLYRQFGSAQKKNHTGTVRNSTPTKSTLSFLTEIPRTYRAAQKRGLTQNNFYDKLFFFRNKRVQSYQIVMKRLKNK